MSATILNSSDSFNMVVTNGGLTAYATNDLANANVRSTTSKTSGKFYLEFLSSVSNAAAYVGFANSTFVLTAEGGISDKNSGAWFGTEGGLYVNGNTLGGLGAFTTGETAQFAIDFTNSLYWGAVDGGEWNGSGTAEPATGVGGISFASAVSGGAGSPWFVLVGAQNSQPVSDITVNFGNSSYAYTAPSGFTGWDAAAGETFALAATWPDFASVIAAADSKPVKSSLLTLYTPLLLR